MATRSVPAADPLLPARRPSSVARGRATSRLALVCLLAIFCGLPTLGWADDAASEGAEARPARRSAPARIVPPPPRQIARVEAPAPALFSASLPLGRLDALPELPVGAIPRVNTGLDWRSLQAPGLPIPTAIDPWARRPDGGPDGVSGLIGALDQILREQSLERPASQSSLRAEFDRLEPEVRAEGPVSQPLLILDDDHSRLLRSLRPDRSPVGDAHGDLFRVRPEPEDPRRQALYALGKKIFHRELRRYFRRDLKDQFRADPSLPLEDYQERRSMIGQLGRGGTAEDLVIEERVTELRNEFLDDSLENPERDLPILQWGPLVLDDRGGVNVDIFGLKRRRHDPFNWEIAPEEQRRGGYGESILFPEQRMSVRSNLKLRPDLRELRDDWEKSFGKLSASVEVDWNAPVLKDRAFSAELGGSIDADGRTGLYLNFIIYGD